MVASCVNFDDGGVKAILAYVKVDVAKPDISIKAASVLTPNNL